MPTVNHPVPGILDEPPLTFNEVIAMTRMSRSTLKLRVKNGDIPSLKMGPDRSSRRLFLRSDVEEYMARHRVVVTHRYEPQVEQAS